MTQSLNRRRFLAQASIGGVAASTLAAPAIAQSNPVLNWRMQSAYPRTIDSLWSGAELFANAMKEATDGAFNIQVFAAGDIVPGNKAGDAVSEGTVEMAYFPTYYNWGKNPAFAIGTGIPFSLSARAYSAYAWEHGGNEAFNDFLAKYNLVGFPGGNTGAQMGGWFRKEINTIEDLKGLKLRVGGIAGKILERLGAVPQQISGGEVYAALEKGAIDAAEWVGPYDDEKLGFVRIAPYYYYPGWWEGSAEAHILTNKELWDNLPERYQELIRICARVASAKVLQYYDARNPAALMKLTEQGAQLRQFSEEILQACFDTSKEVYAEISAENEDFKTLWDRMKEFRVQTYRWQQLSEYTFDSFMMYQDSKGNL